MLPPQLLSPADPQTSFYSRLPMNAEPTKVATMPGASRRSRPSPKRRKETEKPKAEPAAEPVADGKTSGANDQVRIIVVDDHPLFRHGLVQLLTSDTSIHVCGEASSAPEAMAVVRQEKPS